MSEKKPAANACQALINVLEARAGEAVLAIHGSKSYSGFVGKIIKGRYVSHLEIYTSDNRNFLVPINYCVFQMRGGRI